MGSGSFKGAACARTGRLLAPFPHSTCHAGPVHYYEKPRITESDTTGEFVVATPALRGSRTYSLGGSRFGLIFAPRGAGAEFASGIAFGEAGSEVGTVSAETPRRGRSPGKYRRFSVFAPHLTGLLDRHHQKVPCPRRTVAPQGTVVARLGQEGPVRLPCNAPVMPSAPAQRHGFLAAGAPLVIPAHRLPWLGVTPTSG